MPRGSKVQKAQAPIRRGRGKKDRAPPGKGREITGIAAFPLADCEPTPSPSPKTRTPRPRRTNAGRNPKNTPGLQGSEDEPADSEHPPTLSTPPKKIKKRGQGKKQARPEPGPFEPSPNKKKKKKRQKKSWTAKIHGCNCKTDRMPPA